MMKLITWACDPYPHATSLPEQQMRGLWASTGIVAIPGGDRLPVGATMGEQVKRGSDSEDTSESGRAPSDYEESSDEDGGAIPGDADATMQDESDSDYGRGFCWESDSGSIGESVGSDCDSSSHLLDDKHGPGSDNGYGPRSLADESHDDSDAYESMDESDGAADAMAQGLAADVEPMMESTFVQMLLD